MQLQASGKKGFLYLTNTSFLGRSEGKVFQIMLYTCADRILWNVDKPDFLISSVWLVQLFSDGTALNIESSTVVAYPVNAVLLKFSK